MKSILFWLSMPLMLPQAIALRRSAPRFAAAAGPTTGRIGSGRDVSLLAIGDSIAAGVGARRLSLALVGQTALALSETQDVCVAWQSIGKSGMTTKRFLDTRLTSLPARTPDYVIVSLGVNDVTSLSSIRQWRDNLGALFDDLTRRYPGSLILLAGIPPLKGFPLLPEPLRGWIGMRGEMFDTASRALTERYERVHHVPIDFETDPGNFADDGFHPNEMSYEVFGREMAAAINRLQPPTSGTAPGSSRSSA